MYSMISFYLTALFFFTINWSYGQNELLPLDKLYKLDSYAVNYGANGEVLEVWNRRTNQVVTDYSEVEKIRLSTCIDCYDTLWVSNEDFPNLKSLVLDGLFFNELIQVSQLTTLQHLDIAGMSCGDFNTSSYALFFPEEFWNLKLMQSLEISAGYISDVSEKVLSFEHLKHLAINSHGAQDEIAIPWNLLFMKNIEALFFVDMDNYDQEDITLFRECAHFLVLDNEIDYFMERSTDYKLKKPEQDKNDLIQHDTLKMIVDSLSITIPLNEEGLPNGIALLKSGNEIIQRRSYKNGKAHGKWHLRFGGRHQKRKYHDGHYKGKWIFSEKAPYFGDRRIRIKIKRKGEKIIIRYRPVFNAFRVKSVNYNDLEFFDASLD